jgi:magnesium chelatase subunit D
MGGGAVVSSGVSAKGGFPFSAVVGQDEARLALLLAAVDPGIGGVLLRGEKGSAKSTLARGLAGLLPDFAPFVELPVGATEDRVLGSLDLRAALADGPERFRPGLLAAAHGGVLYVDEVNLLPDHLVDAILDAAASGVHRVERDGISHEHPARFVLLGSMNPEEGELRPQLLDRFGLAVEVRSSLDPAVRAEAVRRRLAHDAGRPLPSDGSDGGLDDDELRRRLVDAAPAALPDPVIDFAARLAVNVGAESLRADLVLCRAAAALAGWEGRAAATEDDVAGVAPLALGHRHRRRPFDPPTLPPDALTEAIARARAESPRPSSPPTGATAGPTGPGPDSDPDTGRAGAGGSNAGADGSNTADSGRAGPGPAPTAHTADADPGTGARPDLADTGQGVPPAGGAGGVPTSGDGTPGRGDAGPGGRPAGDAADTAAQRPDARWLGGYVLDGDRDTGGGPDPVRWQGGGSTSDEGRWWDQPAGKRGNDPARSNRSGDPSPDRSRPAGNRSDRPSREGRWDELADEASKAHLALEALAPTPIYARSQQDRGPVRPPRTGGTGSGRTAVADTGPGRTVGHRTPGPDGPEGIAVVPTVRAALQRRQHDPEGPALTLDDVREPRRIRKQGRTVVLVVDASGSMGTASRISAATGAVLGLLADAYVRRDQVALVAFRDDGATEVLPPTASVELARAHLADLPTGGATPLAEGLTTALRTAQRVVARGSVPLLVVLTDGRATGSPGALDRARDAARAVAAAGIEAVVLDAEDDDTRLGLAAELVALMDGRYLHLSAITAEAIETAVRSTLE